MNYKGIYIGSNKSLVDKLTKESDLISFSMSNHLMDAVKSMDSIDLIIYEETEITNDLILIKNLKENLSNNKVVLFVINENSYSPDYIKIGAHDVFHFDSHPNDIVKRFEFIFKNYETLSGRKTEVLQTFKLPVWKRTFDILFSGGLLLFLLPIFIVIAILIR